MIYFLPTGNCCTAGTAYCLYCSWPDRAPRSGSQPRRPSCICSGLEPHCRTSRCARPQPTPSPRCCSLTSLPGTANCTYRGYCHCINCGTAGGGPLSLRATRSGRQSRRRPATTLASELHHRTVLLTATSCTAARQFVSAGPFGLSALREKPYPRHHPMSTPAIIDFQTPFSEVIGWRGERRPAVQMKRAIGAPLAAQNSTEADEPAGTATPSDPHGARGLSAAALGPDLRTFRRQRSLAAGGRKLRGQGDGHGGGRGIRGDGRRSTKSRLIGRVDLVEFLC